MNPIHSDKNQDSSNRFEKEGLKNLSSSSKDYESHNQIQDNANNSIQLNNQNNIQQLINQSPQVQKGKELQNFMNNSNYMIAQRKRAGVIENHFTQKEQSEEQTQKENPSGMPDSLKSGIENLSGMNMDDVHVHYNSEEPAQLNALAFVKGTDIHLSPGQENYLPHEAWHIVQQKQGRVKPSMQMKSASINDDQQLEKEADEMGAKAMNGKISSGLTPVQMKSGKNENIIQRKVFLGNKDSAKKIQKIPKDLKDKGSGDRKIDTMVSDDIDRHFLDHQELENYMSNSTETIGVVDKEKTWVRLTEGELMVLGELHTQTVLTDVAKAVNTSRFVYEPYNELPKDMKSVEVIETSDEAKWQKNAGMGRSDKVNHTMEFILPKLVFSLEYIKGVILQGKLNDFKKIQDERYNIAERLSHYLSMAMSMAKDLADAKKDDLEIVKYYKGNKDLLDATILDAGNGTYLGDLAAMNKNTTNQNIIYNFCVAFIDYSIQDFESKKDSESPDQQTTDAVDEIKKQNHSKDKSKKPRSTAANTWREFYMYQNVLRAKVLNFLLAGMGDAHRQDMADKLSKVSGLKALTMDDFIKINQTNNTEISKNAKVDKLTENEYPLTVHHGYGKEEAVPLDKAAMK